MSKNLIESVDFYYDENGNVVFTELFHLHKGVCCGNGCRHCPFNFESVPEPRRSAILAQEKA